MMKGLLESDGNLYILRGKEYKEQECPFDTERNWYCGDWCPQMGEPREVVDDPRIFLPICQNKTLAFEEFEDRRGEQDGEELKE